MESKRRKKKPAVTLQRYKDSLEELDRLELEDLRHDMIELKKEEVERRQEENAQALATLKKQRNAPKEDLSRYQIPPGDIIKFVKEEEDVVKRDDVLRLIVFWAWTRKLTGEEMIDEARLFTEFRPPAANYTLDQAFAIGENMVEAFNIGIELARAKSPEERSQLQKRILEILDVKDLHKLPRRPFRKANAPES